MANNKVQVDVIIDDKGNLKKVAHNANKAGQGLDQAAKASNNYNKGQKGVAGATSNSTKAFAKMSGGMGGLVGAYATLAANVFAISAAFEFMKSAGNLQVLQSGQAAYAASTGIAIRTLTSDIMAATDAQLGFEDAAQAAAIGLAAGLSSDQLVKLGKAAKDTSTVLGRDLTDSFNRLVRGATKAEPELLDELGIILRLDTATANYARTLGKSAKDLTAFERSQAVTNDILTQSEEKYGKMLENTNTFSNSVTKLGKAFENDLLKPIKLFLAAVATPIFEFLSKNVYALGLALGALALPIIKAIIPGLSGMTDAAKEAATEARKHADEVRKASNERIQQLRQERAELLNTKKAATDYAQTLVSGLKAKKGSGLAALQAGDQISGRQSQGMQRAIAGGKGEYAKLTQAQRDDLLSKLKQMETATKASTTRIQRMWNFMATGFKTQVAGMKAVWAGFTAFMKSAASVAVRGVNTAFKALAIIGTIMMVIDLAKMGYEAIRNMFRTDAEKEAAKAQDRYNEKLKTSIDRARELSDELDDIRKGQLASSTVGATEISKAGQIAGNINKEQVLFLLGSGDAEAMERARENLHKTSIIMKDIKSTSLQADFRKFDFSKTPTLESAKQFLALLSKIQEQGASMEAFTKALANQAKTVTDLVTSYLPSTKFDEAIDNVRNIEKALKDAELSGARGALNRDENKQLKKAREQGAVLVKLRDTQVKSAQNLLNIEIKEMQASRGLTNLQVARLSASTAIEKTEENIRLNLQEISNLKAVINLRDGIITDNEQNQLDLMELQTQKLREQAQTQRDQIDNQKELSEAFRNAFESSMTTNIADLIKGNESSLKDAMMKIAQSALSSVADKLSEQLSLKISDFIFGSPTDPAVVAQKDNTTAVKELTSAITKIGTAPSVPSVTTSAGESVLGAVGTAVVKDVATGEAVNEVVTVGAKKAVIPFVTAFGDFFANFKSQEVSFGDSLKGLFSDIGTDFKGIFSSVGGFLKNLFTGGAGGGGFLSSALSFGASLFGFGGGVPGAKTGGIMTPQGKVQGYATGGIARGSGSGYPAMLHGTEAVVPLPNGRSIPVDMPQNAGQQQNNVVVNVSADGRTDTSGSSGPDMDKLGIAIAKAVQQELQSQKRSGGILSPYGAA